MKNKNILSLKPLNKYFEPLLYKHIKRPEKKVVELEGIFDILHKLKE